jgi:hypothetical protein
MCIRKTLIEDIFTIAIIFASIAMVASPICLFLVYVRNYVTIKDDTLGIK